MFKICRKCNHKKHLCDFYKQKSSSDGHGSYCKECTKESVAAHRKEKPELKKTQDKRHYLKNKEKYKANCKNYRLHNRSAVNNAQKKRYKANRIEILQYQKVWALENPYKIKLKYVKSVLPKNSPIALIESKVLYLLIKSNIGDRHEQHNRA